MLKREEGRARREERKNLKREKTKKKREEKRDTN